MNLSGPKRPSWRVALLTWTGVIVGAVGIIAQVAPESAAFHQAVKQNVS